MATAINRNASTYKEQIIASLQPDIDRMYDLSQMATKFQIKQVIGIGAYGTVVAADVIPNSGGVITGHSTVNTSSGNQMNITYMSAMAGQRVAIKCVSSRILNDAFTAHRVLREIRLLAHLRGHPNVLGLTDLVPIRTTSFSKVFIITDLMDIDLDRLLRSPQLLTEDHAIYYTYQLFAGLSYIHSAGVAHRDLKPSNILVNYSNLLKICDFGLARSVQGNAQGATTTPPLPVFTDYVCTRHYRAPELVMEDVHYTTQVDIWSVGCIIAEFFTPYQTVLLGGENRVKQLEVIINFLGTPKQEDIAQVGSIPARQYISTRLADYPGVNFADYFRKADHTKLCPEAIDLLTRCLTFNPRNRITAIEGLRHPYLKEYYKPEDELSVDRFMLDNVSTTDLRRLKQIIFEDVTNIRNELIGETQTQTLQCFQQQQQQYPVHTDTTGSSQGSPSNANCQQGMNIDSIAENSTSSSSSTSCTTTPSSGSSSSSSSNSSNSGCSRSCEPVSAPELREESLSYSIPRPASTSRASVTPLTPIEPEVKFRRTSEVNEEEPFPPGHWPEHGS